MMDPMGGTPTDDTGPLLDALFERLMARYEAGAGGVGAVGPIPAMPTGPVPEGPGANLVAEMMARAGR